MPNPIKYTTGSETNALKKGNFYIGTGDVGKGPSETTGYYQGVSPSAGGYVIYMNKTGAPGSLSYHNAPTDAELISFTNNLAGQSYTTVNECLVYFAGQTDKVCVNRDYEGIVTDGLVLNVDAGFTPSYPKNGTTWYDVGGDNNGTLTNGPTFSTDGGGSIVFDGTNDYVLVSNNGFGTFNNQTWAVEAWVYLDTTSSERVIFSYDYTTHKEPYYSTHLRVLAGGIFLGWNNGVNYKFIGTQLNTVLVNRWYHIIGTYESGNQKIYVNGQPIKSGTATDTITFYNQPVWVGIANFGGYFDGNISLVRYYNRTLLQQEVTQNYNAQKGRFGL